MTERQDGASQYALTSKYATESVHATKPHSSVVHRRDFELQSALSN